METTAVALASAYLLVREEYVPARWAVPTAVALGFLSGAGRLYLDRHWGSDLLGGWLAGIAIAAAASAAGEAAAG